MIPRSKCESFARVLFAACFLGSASGSAAAALRCVVSIPPLASIVEEIGGSRVVVSVLVNAGQDPHTFEPTPGQIRTLINADLLFTVGLPFESVIVPRVQGPDDRPRLCDTSTGSTLIEANHVHQTGVHGRVEIDRHIWLSPKNLESMAISIREALTTADPAGARHYDLGNVQFIEKLKYVHRKNLELLSPLEGQAFTVFHPSFGYFADAYTLKQRAVEAEGKPPTARELARLISRSKASEQRVIFVQPQFDRKHVSTIAAAIGAEVRTLDPLARDVLANLEIMGREISRALSDRAQPMGKNYE